MKKFIQSLLTLLAWPILLVAVIVLVVLGLVVLLVLGVCLVVVLTICVIVDFITLGQLELMDYWITLLL